MRQFFCIAQYMDTYPSHGLLMPQWINYYQTEIKIEMCTEAQISHFLDYQSTYLPQMCVISCSACI